MTQTFSEDTPLSIMELVHDGDQTRKYLMQCRNHPELRYTSADPRGGSPVIAKTAVCECSWVYLDIIGRTEKPMTELNPRFSNSRKDNLLLVSKQMAEADVPYAKIEEIMTEAAKAPEGQGPLSDVLERHGYTVHWVN